MPIYISTSCLVNGSNVFNVLETYSKANLRNVELGSSHEYVSCLLPAKFRQYDFNFIVHHYFPPPPQPLMVNLASQYPVILKRSRDQIRRSIEFCHSLGIKLFTFHAGFRADPNSKLQFAQEQPVVPYEIAFDTFVESVKDINDYAQDRGIKIAVENNVLSAYNLVNGQNVFLLLCEAEEFERLWENVSSDNVGIALDLGHLKVTSRWLGFNRYDFIQRVKHKVFSIHLHENNGRVDEHKELDKASWCLEAITERCFAQVPIVLESTRLNIDQIIKNRDLIERCVRVPGGSGETNDHKDR